MFLDLLDFTKWELTTSGQLTESPLVNQITILHLQDKSCFNQRVLEVLKLTGGFFTF